MLRFFPSFERKRDHYQSFAQFDANRDRGRNNSGVSWGCKFWHHVPCNNYEENSTNIWAVKIRKKGNQVDYSNCGKEREGRGWRQLTLEMMIYEHRNRKRWLLACGTFCYYKSKNGNPMVTLQFDNFHGHGSTR